MCTHFPIVELICGVASYSSRLLGDATGIATMTSADIRIPFCTIAALNSCSLCYRVCRACEAPVPDFIHALMACVQCGARLSENGTQMLYRLQLSIATEDKVFPVIAFDRAARTLMGCSADEFYHFASCNPFTVENASKALLGEMVELTLRPPKSGRAQHMRVVSVIPLAPDFEQIIGILKRTYTKGS